MQTVPSQTSDAGPDAAERIEDTREYSADDDIEMDDDFWDSEFDVDIDMGAR